MHYEGANTVCIGGNLSYFDFIVCAWLAVITTPSGTLNCLNWMGGGTGQKGEGQDCQGAGAGREGER